jgi:hypothetical protein
MEPIEPDKIFGRSDDDDDDEEEEVSSSRAAFVIVLVGVCFNTLATPRR